MERKFNVLYTLQTGGLLILKPSALESETAIYIQFEQVNLIITFLIGCV